VSLLCAAANRLWSCSVQRGRRRFDAALDRPREVQLGLLKRYVRDNAVTAFGHSHGFEKIDSLERFRSRVPLTTWDDYAPFADRIRLGEPRVLTAEPVRRLVPSSGSARAVKLVPYTPGLQREFNAAIGPWVADLYGRWPDLMNGPAYWSITPAADLPAVGPSAVPIGFDEDSAYLGSLLKPVVDATLAVPARVRRSLDMARFRRRTLFHLLRAVDLRLISVWHPSFLSLLIESMEAMWPALLGMFERRGMRRRFAELCAAGPREVSRIWPRLGLISAWGDAHAGLSLAELRRRWPGVAVQEKGLLATEAFVTIPYLDARPLAVRSHFFEFLDEQDGRCLLADELRQGGTYRVVVTTAGGLYRYQLGDRVEVIGRLGRTPSLRFAGRADAVSDWRGEKLSEGFVGAVIRDLLTAAGVRAVFAMLAPQQVDDGHVRYVLFIECDDVLSTDPSSAELDRRLAENPHYDYCRRIGQLGPADVAQVRRGAYEAYVARLVAAGQRLGNVKSAALSALDDWEKVFAPVHAREDASRQLRSPAVPVTTGAGETRSV
jgi:hypothetical protein